MEPSITRYLSPENNITSATASAFLDYAEQFFPPMQYVRYYRFTEVQENFYHSDPYLECNSRPIIMPTYRDLKVVAEITLLTGERQRCEIYVPDEFHDLIRQHMELHR